MLKKGCTILILIIMLGLTGCDYFDYKKATKLTNDNQYDEAIEILKTIPGYKDSDTIVKDEGMYQ